MVGYTGATNPDKQELDQFHVSPMALVQRLLIRQTQALVMTPQLMQAIKLLQLSHLDLATYVDAELERNPLLERPSEEDSIRNDSDAIAETSSAKEEDPRSADWM